jgi:uncharacterized membrane protein
VHAATVTLEELPVPSFVGTAGVSNIAADGTVVGTGWPDAVVVRWLPGQPPENLGGDTFTLENVIPLISADAETIVANIYVQEGKDLFSKAAIWQGGTTWQPISGETLAQSTPFGLSDNGSFIAGTGWVDLVPAPGAGEQAWVWSSDTGQSVLGEVDGLVGSQAWAVSNDGAVAAGFADPGAGSPVRHAVRWTGGVAQRIVDAEERPVGQAIACNSDCSVMVGAGFVGVGGSNQAWRWTAAGGIEYLGELDAAPAGSTYYAFDTTEDGSMIVGAYPMIGEDGSSMNHGFVWTAESGLIDMVDFLAQHGIDYGANFNELVVNSITRDGQHLLINGGNQDYQRQRAIVHIAPEVEVVFADGFEAVVE